MFDINWSEILLLLPAVIIALSCHEYAHARVAYSLGDPTAKIQGRMTINPLRHLDPVGTLMLLFFHFGWAKPVPINPYNFRRVNNKHFGTLLVSLAGPVMNLLLAVLGSLLMVLLLKGVMPLFSSTGNDTLVSFFINLFYFLLLFSQINIVLAVFNLIPLPPLDGSKILAGLLPMRWADKFYQYERYGWIIMVLLLMTGALSRLIGPIIGAFERVIFNITGLSGIMF